MKVAVCYSGMIRGFLDNIENHKEFLLSKYDCDVYLSFWDVYGYGYLPFSRYKSDKHIRFDIHGNKTETIPITKSDLIEESVKNEIVERLSPKDFIFESFKSYEPTIEEKEKPLMVKYNYTETECSIGQLLAWNTMGGYYRIYKCGEMVKNSGIQYDAVVRMRPDSILEDVVTLQKPEKGIIYGNQHASWSDNVLNDSLLYGDMESMEIYRDMHNHLIDVFHNTQGPGQSAEHLLYVYLTSMGLKINKDLFAPTHSYHNYREREKSKELHNSEWFKSLGK
jgi:hypothetical protein